MKAGRKPWHVRVGKPVLERIRLAIAGGDDPRTVYAQYQVKQYGCSPRSFRRWCSWLKRELSWRTEAPAEERQSTAEEVEQALLDSMLITLDAGGVPDGKLSQALTSVTSKRRLEAAKRFKEQAEKRAQELHEVEMAKVRKTLRTAIDTASENGAKPLTRDAIYDEIDKAMREQKS